MPLRLGPRPGEVLVWDLGAVDPDVAVITPISLDHQEYLGDTIEEILKRNRNENALRFVRSRPCAACHGVTVPVLPLRLPQCTWPAIREVLARSMKGFV